MSFPIPRHSRLASLILVLIVWRATPHAAGAIEYRFTFPEPVVLKRFVAPLCVFIFGIARSLYLGVRIIVMDFPSRRPALSIFATSANSLLTRSSTACPSSG